MLRIQSTDISNPQKLRIGIGVRRAPPTSIKLKLRITNVRWGEYETSAAFVKKECEIIRTNLGRDTLFKAKVATQPRACPPLEAEIWQFLAVLTCMGELL